MNELPDAANFETTDSGELVADSGMQGFWGYRWKRSPNSSLVNYVSWSYGGIVAAGGAYPFFLILCTLIYNAFELEGIWQIPPILFGLVMSSFFFGFFGVLVTSITGAVSIDLVVAFNMSLGSPLTPRSAAISAGSLTGYISTVWILFVEDVVGGTVDITLIGLVGPILAMLLCAYGAARASSVYGGLDFAMATHRPRYRLTIQILLGATTWIAFAIVLTGLFGLWFAITLAGWFVLQAILLCFVYLYQTR